MSMNLQKVPPSQSSARRTGWMKKSTAVLPVF